MSVSALALTALMQLQVAQSPPELVVLPLATKGAKAADGLAAWKIVTGAVEGAKKRLKVSTALQKKRHDFLVGPAREQAQDCGFKKGCLTEVGTTLGANLLVAGRVEKDGIVLIALDVSDGSSIGEVSSGKRVAKKSLKAKANAVSKQLIRLLKNQAKAPPVAVATKSTKDSPPKSDTSKASGLDEKIDESPMPSDEAKDASPGGSPPVLAQGTMVIPASELRGVSTVTVDGTPAPFGGDGSVTWAGDVGIHRVVATRVDGQSSAKDVRINPNETTNVELALAAVAAPALTTASTVEDDDDSVVGKWWFWTSLGAAVAAGTTTAVLLAGGEKGGPSLPSSSGSIRGTY